MALPVPTDFVCSYNGFTHDPETACTTALTVTPMPDATGRTAQCNRVYLKIRSEISGTPTDARVLQARQKLTKYGGVLIYGGRGFGPLNINTGKVRDIDFGPKPKVLSITLLGCKTRSVIEWECETQIPECADARYSLGFLSLAYRMETHIRVDGRADHVVTGTLRIPNNRVAPGSDRIIDSPDLYRSTIAPPPGPGFRREWQPWRVDESRTSLGFGWTDKEYGPNVLPPGIVKMDSGQTFRQKSEYSLVQAVATLRATITVDAQYDSSAAEKAFFGILVEQRYRRRKRDNATGIGNRPISYIPVTFEASEPDIFGDQLVCEFSFTYLVTGTSFQTYIRDSGLWEPLGTEWFGWYKSVRNSSLSAYGISRLVFTPNLDQIVDLCQANPGGLRPPGKLQFVEQGKLGGTRQPPIDEAGSWLRYLNNLYVETDSGTVEMRSLSQKDLAPPKPSSTPAELRSPTATPREIAPTPRPVASDPGGYQSLQGAIANFEARRAAVGGTGRGSGGTGGGSGRGKGNPPPPDAVTNKPPPDPNDVLRVQRRTRPVVALYLIGEATRVGFDIPPPTLGDVDGIVPISANRMDMGEGFVCGIVGTTLTGVPIYGARWKLRYVLPQAPAGPVIPPDPATWLGRRLG